MTKPSKLLTLCVLATWIVCSAPVFAKDLSRSKYELRNYAITGLAIAEKSSKLYLTGYPRLPESRSQIIVGDLENPSVYKRIFHSKEGVVPYTPALSRDETFLIYAGFCRDDNPVCNDKNRGWNLYRLDLVTGKNTQLTKSNLKITRWQPVLDDHDVIYYLALRRHSGLGMDRIIASTAFMRLDAKGQPEVILPKNTGAGFAAEGLEQLLYHPDGKFGQVQLLHVSNDRIIFAGKFRIHSQPPPKFMLEIRRERQLDYDPRISEAADRYREDRNKSILENRIFGRTLYQLDQSGLALLEAIRGTRSPERLVQSNLLDHQRFWRGKFSARY